MPGNLGSRKHLILIKTEGSGRRNKPSGGQRGAGFVFIWKEAGAGGGGAPLNYSLMKVHPEKVII